MDRVDIGKIILAIKNRYGIKLQKEIAVSLGLQESNLSAIKSGSQPITDDLIERLKDVYMVNPEYMKLKSSNMWIDTTDGNVPSDNDDRVEYLINEIKAKFGYKNRKDICKRIGVDLNFFSELKGNGRRKDYSDDVIVKLRNVFGVNPLFLAHDSDILWLPEKHVAAFNGNNNTNVQGNDNSINQNMSEVLERAFDEIAAQRRLTENAQQLNSETHLRLAEVTKILDKLTDKGQQA